MKVGLIGCGNISPQYLTNLPAYPGVEVAACSDLITDKARSRAEEFGVPVFCTTEELLANPDIDIAVNLTQPANHTDVSLAAIAAGKHVYSEKPLAVEREDGDAILRAARKAGVIVGCAPDTFLGAGIQTCRKLIDDGRIGRPIGAMASFLNHGHEHWHPDPAFYYEVGGGPMFDMGPYYLTALVFHCSAPSAGVRRTRAGLRPQADHQRTAQRHDDRRGGLHPRYRATRLRERGDWNDSHQLRRVGIRNPLAGNLRHRRYPQRARPQHVHRPGAGPARASGEWEEVPLEHPEGGRGIGVADMADALRSGRRSRVDAAMPNHVLDIMHAVHESSDTGRHVELQTTCPRPEPIPPGLPLGRFT